MLHRQLSSILLLAGITGLSTFACSGDEEDEEIYCDEEGQCDTVAKTPCDSKAVDETGQTAANKRFIGRLNDPLAKLAFRTGSDCPTTFPDLMAKLRKTDNKDCPEERDGITTRMVSETAQALDKQTNYRGVVTRQCGGREQHELIFSTFGLTPNGGVPDSVEIIGFDKTAGVFNFYEVDGNKVHFFGNSKDMLKGTGGRCIQCHPNGGLVMKELHSPWLHWGGHKDVAGASKLIEKHADFGTEADGIDMEGLVSSGNSAYNAKRLTAAKRSGKAKDALRPLFCTTELNIDNGADFESPIKGGTGGDEMNSIPFDSLLHPKLKSFGSIPVTFADYDAQIKANGQKVSGLTGAIDTIFDYAFLEVAAIDDEWIDKLIEAKFVDEAFVKDVLIVDFTRHVFSDERCALLEFAPDMKIADMTPAKVRDGFIARLEAEKPAAGSAGAVFLGNLKRADDTANHDKAVDDFVAACTALGSKKLVENALKITSLNRNLARERPIIEFEATLPTDNLRTAKGSRLSPKTCEVVTSFVAP